MDSEAFAKDRERKPSEVFDAATTPEGYLKCSVRMKWPWVKDRFRMMLVARKTEFHVHLSGPWQRLLPNELLSTGDCILLDLRGAKMEKGRTPTLKYEDGFLMQHICCGTSGNIANIIDGWKPLSSSGDWFMTQATAPVEPTSIVSPQVGHNPIPHLSRAPQAAGSFNYIPDSAGDQNASKSDAPALGAISESSRDDVANTNNDNDTGRQVTNTVRSLNSNNKPLKPQASFTTAHAELKRQQVEQVEDNIRQEKRAKLRPDTDPIDIPAVPYPPSFDNIPHSTQIPTRTEAPMATITEPRRTESLPTIPTASSTSKILNLLDFSKRPSSSQTLKSTPLRVSRPESFTREILPEEISRTTPDELVNAPIRPTVTKRLHENTQQAETRYQYDEKKRQKKEQQAARAMSSGGSESLPPPQPQLPVQPKLSKRQKKKQREEKKDRKAARSTSETTPLGDSGVDDAQEIVKVTLDSPVEPASEVKPTLNKDSAGTSQPAPPTSSLVYGEGMSEMNSSIMREVQRVESLHDGDLALDKPTSAAVPLPVPIHEIKDSPTAAVPESENLEAVQISAIHRGTRYPPLKSLLSMKGRVVDIIGVAIGPRNVIKRRGTKDLDPTPPTPDSSAKVDSPLSDAWFTTIRIVDSSVVRSANDLLLPKPGVAINLFANFRDWLPEVESGQAVVLRRLMVDNFQDKLTATGWSDSYQFAIFDGTSGFRPAVLSRGTPEEIHLGGEGRGRTYSPFIRWTDPACEKDAVSSKCSAVHAWWSSVEKDFAANRGPVHDVKGRPQREHRLIEAATPGMQPSGFFDCTVEILYVYPNASGPNSVYVTDYTIVQGGAPVTAEWCPSALSEKVLKIEMWDGCKELSAKMNPGQMWSFVNVRMRNSNGGYVEGKLVEAKKQSQLVEDDADNHSHLRALLERKKAWQKKGLSVIWPHYCVENIPTRDAPRFFDLTVEFLHFDSSGGRIYVTDYTCHPQLPELPPMVAQQSWTKGKENMIMPIHLDGDQQRKHATMLREGVIYRFRKLSMVANSATRNQWMGRWGGVERMFDQLGSHNSGEEVATLRQNKSNWERDLPTMTSNAPKSEPPASPLAIKPIARPSPHVLPTSCHGTRPLLSLKQATSIELPDKIRVVARVTGIFPPELHGCTILQCSNPSCARILDDAHDACLECKSDSSPERTFHFLLRIADAEGTELDILISSKENWLTRGLDADLHHPGALQAFAARLKPLLGEIDEDSILQPLKFPDHTPLLQLGLQCWSCDEERVYELVRFAISAQ